MIKRENLVYMLIKTNHINEASIKNVIENGIKQEIFTFFIYSLADLN